MINYNGRDSRILEILEAAGFIVRQIDNVHYAYDSEGNQSPTIDAAVQAICDDYDHLPFARETAKTKIIKEAEDAIDDLVLSKYPCFEVDTWSIQKSESEAYALDPAAITPMLDRIIAKRGVDKAKFMDRVSKKVKEFSEIAGDYAGARQKAFDLIDSSDDLLIIESIKFEV